MSVTYVICAAGEGSRFRAAFGDTPKALIRLCGATLLEWSLRSLPIFADDRLVLITQRKHRVREKMHAHIQNQYPFNALHWLEIPELTRGQLETATLARPYTPPESGLVVFNCDTYFQSPTLPALLADPTVDGVIPCAEAEGTAWSFCLPDERGRALEVSEKERISPWASVGLYAFRDAAEFFARAEEALSRPADKAEYFVAPLYQDYIVQGRNIFMDRVTLFKPMGTPDQIETFWNRPLAEVKAENARPVMVIDLDNTITIDEPGTPYPDKKPNRAVIDKMRAFRAAGWELVIFTSRRMETCGGDESRVLANVGQITLDWLSRHEVPFDGIRFGKPYARRGFYVDDKSMTPEAFLAMDPAL